MTAPRIYVCFASVFRSESTPCVSHETVNGVKTFCGRKVTDTATVEPDNNDLDPDCRVCSRAARRLKESCK